MISCLLPSFPWYIYFFNLTETVNFWVILLCSNVDLLSFLLSSRPHDSSFSPHLTLTGLFFYGTYSSKPNFQLPYSSWSVETSGRKSLNCPCYHQGKFMIFNISGHQCHRENLLCFQSMLPSGCITNSNPLSVLSLSSVNSLRRKF